VAAIHITDMFHLCQDQYQLVRNDKLVQEYEAMVIVMLPHRDHPYSHLSIEIIKIIFNKRIQRYLLQKVAFVLHLKSVQNRE